MSGDSSNPRDNDDELSVPMRKRIGGIADRFEADLRGGTSPRIEDYAADTDDMMRAVLLRELLLVELEHLRSNGEKPSIEEYERRFSDDGQVVADAFARVPHESVDRTQDADERPAASAGLHIRCPNCHQPVEVVVDTPFAEIVCSTCGSHFSIAGDSDETRGGRHHLDSGPLRVG